MKSKVITIGLLWVFLLAGCAAIQREKIPAESIIPQLQWNLESYAEFVKENMTEINAHPLKWQSVEETIKTQKGDCKNLSLLLMSYLTTAGYDTYAGISNGHMWVNVNHDNQWQILELDLDPERNTIYRIPGFYENPLYKIYPDRSEKRKIIKQP